MGTISAPCHGTNLSDISKHSTLATSLQTNPSDLLLYTCYNLET